MHVCLFLAVFMCGMCSCSQANVVADVKGALQMRGVDASELRVEPLLEPNKSKLLVSHYLRVHPFKTALVKLYRPFVSALHSHARAQLFGCSGMPSFYDADAMQYMVEFFNLERLLDEAWMSEHPISKCRLTGRQTDR